MRVGVEAAVGDLPLHARGGHQREVPAAAGVGLGQLLQRAHAPARHPRVLAAAALDDVEAHDLLGRRLAGGVLEHDLRARPEGAEVDQDLDPLRGVQREPRARDGPLEQAAVGGDLQHLAPVAELEVVRARVGRVEEPQAVDPALDGHPRRDRAVDQQRVTAEAEVDVLGVAERAVLVEGVVGEHDRHVVLVARELELLLALVAEQVGGDQPVVQRARRAAVRVVVVPEERRVLVVRVHVVEALARLDDVHRMPVMGSRDVAAVQVHVGVEREVVLLAHDRGAALARADRRAGVDALVAVDRRLEAGQDLGRALLDVDLVDVRPVLGGDGGELRHDRQVALERLERRGGLRAAGGRGHGRGLRDLGALEL